MVKPPLVPATQQAEAGELEVTVSQDITTAPSQGDKARLCLKKKNKKKNQKINCGDIYVENFILNKHEHDKCL